jgi:hypothetical protein
MNTYTYVSAAQTNIENSPVFNWGSDSTVIPNDAVLRAFLASLSYFTLYIQVPESSLESPLGVTITKQPGAVLRPVATAIHLLYFDGTNWSTDSLAYLDASVVTEDAFTLKVEDPGTGARRLRLWNGRDTEDLVFNAESSDISSTLYAGRTPGQAVIAVSFLYAGTYGTTSDWLQGVLTTRVSIT